jgi:hypothetical protein
MKPGRPNRIVRLGATGAAAAASIAMAVLGVTPAHAADLPNTPHLTGPDSGSHQSDIVRSTPPGKPDIIKA